MDDAVVKGYSIVKDDATIRESSKVDFFSLVGADTIVMGNSCVLRSKVRIYSSITQEKSGILGDSIIRECNIKATGFIQSTRIEYKNLTGRLNPFM